ncbi:MAG: hypothetical protein QXU82_02880 [Candidatus Aenigmatarchaeota archaeon]
MKQMLVWGLLFGVLVSATAIAASFSATITSEPDVFAGDTATFEATISNSGPMDWFSISVFPTDWVRLESPSVKVVSGGTFSIKVFITPPENARAGIYDLKLYVSKGGEKVEVPFQVSVKQRTTAALIENMRTSCTVCKDSINVTLKVENVGNSDIRDAKLSLKLGSQEKVVEIGELNATKSVDVSEAFPLAGFMPGSSSVVALLTGNGANLDVETKTFEVAVIDNIDVQREVSSFLFGNKVTLTATNEGNIEKAARITSAVSQYYWIVYSGPRADEQGAQWTWIRTLKPGESATIEYSEFVWPIPVILVIIVIGAIYGYLQATALAVKKRVTGGAGEYGISIAVKNRGQHAEDVVVRDVIPPHFMLSGTFETLKPVAKKTSFGTELFWKMGRIKKGEEMILHYRMKPASGIRGTVQLPAAGAKARRGQKTFFAYSSKPVITGISTGQPKLKVKAD